MKKIFTLACCLCAAMGMTAQTVFVTAPTRTENGEIYLLGERMSDNGTFVAGMDLMSYSPFVWNTENGELDIITEMEEAEQEIWDEEGNVIGTEVIEISRSGSFHDVSNNGVAVGGFSSQVTTVTQPVSFDMFGIGDYEILYNPEGDEKLGFDACSAEAYGITADGKTIAGFRYIGGWTVQGCLWTDNGQTRTDLPLPTEEQMGTPIDYATARGITPDGKVVWGFCQDATTGAWVACHWTRNEDGSYEPHSWAHKYYQTTTYDENYDPIEVENPNPFMSFEPLAVSNNGEWMTLILTKELGMGWWAPATEYAARLNLVTGELTELEWEGDGPELFGVANDGTCVGRLTTLGEDEVGEYTEMVDAVIWPGDSNSLLKLADLYADDEYASQWTASALSTVSGDGTKLMGYASDMYNVQSTFVVNMPNLTGINSVLAPSAKAEHTYDLAGRAANANRLAAKGIYIQGGKKVIR